MDETLDARAYAAACRWLPGNDTLRVRPHGHGHINDTFLVTSTGPPPRSFILQRINRRVFSDVAALMENIAAVTAHLQMKLRQENADPRGALSLVYTPDGRAYYSDSRKDCWRRYVYVENTVSYDMPESPGMFYSAARTFGKFSRLLSDFPARTLHETLPGFHDTAARLGQLEDAVHRDACGRVCEVQAELEFIMARRDETPLLEQMRKAGELPVRVTHNDTKFNNVLIDADTGEGVCVIDLDTVMPGLTAYDFGDAIRFGANTIAEDSLDLHRCGIDLTRYRQYAEGFTLGGTSGLTPAETDALPLGAKMMTFENGMRFLADYLNGDVYFKTSRPRQNLDRARTQLALTADMEAHWDEMRRIIREVTEK